MKPHFETFKGHLTMADYVRSFIADMEAGSSKEVDIDTGDKAAAKFRMTLAKVSTEAGKKFRTKRDVNGSLWVMRII